MMYLQTITYFGVKYRRYSLLFICHPREGGDPENENWIPVYTGMTDWKGWTDVKH
jgi:hypothetical protein